QVDALFGRKPDLVALLEVVQGSVSGWRDRCERAGLGHVLDSSDLRKQESLSGMEYRRKYFNLIGSRWPLHRLPDLQLELPERYVAATVARQGSEFELHVAGVPPGSRVGMHKVEMFEALYERLASTSELPRILCGDLN